MPFATILKSMRLPFVILSPVCVFLGASVANFEGGNSDYLNLGLALLGAVLGHISVNCLNEYSDFKSGLDLNTFKTPFSGGSGALPDNPSYARFVLLAGVLCLMVILSIGSYFLYLYGFAILPLGLVAVFLILAYTNWLNKNPLLCLIAPGIGFGPLMVGGTHFVLTGAYSNLSWLVSLVPFFLVSNLLLLNQYPDIEADKGAGRRHLPIAYGVKVGNMVYAAFIMATLLVVSLGTYFNHLPPLSLIALLPLILALFSISGAIKFGADIGQHPQFMAANVGVSLLTPLLLGIALQV
ncbi:prenyltransferase [Paraglaciecola sp. MB-3u-78]|uniref:prenyltransferase n=1 Tax=Paraglaciecola sp. MB-3u-78 TaxID=2058332 RepID=UPI001E304D35|nr:prenyltransferase [Paraglaciecola sp. MB-3u-78]